MHHLDPWLAQRGPALAVALESQREPICDEVASRLATTFPTLCYDPGRPDAQQFQQQTYQETPRRFHRLIQVLLLFQTLSVIEREYRWGWPLLQRYGVERRHLLTHIRFYFEGTRAKVALSAEDVANLALLEAEILAIVEQVTRPEANPHSNGRLRSNGIHH